MMDQSGSDNRFRSHRPPMWMPLLVIGGMVIASFLIVMLVVAHDRTAPPPAKRNLALDAEVVAISADPSELTSERFKEYGAFAFPVLFDPAHKVARKFGTIRALVDGEGEPVHGTFIISRDGRVVWANRGGEPFTENLTLLRELARCEEKRMPRCRSRPNPGLEQGQEDIHEEH